MMYDVWWRRYCCGDIDDDVLILSVIGMLMSNINENVNDSLLYIYVFSFHIYTVRLMRVRKCFEGELERDSSISYRHMLIRFTGE